MPGNYFKMTKRLDKCKTQPILTIRRLITRERLCLSANGFPNYSKKRSVGRSVNQVTKNDIGEQLKANEMD